MDYPPELIKLVEFEQKTIFYRVNSDVEVEISGLVTHAKIDSFRDTERLKVHIKLDGYEFISPMDLKFIVTA